MSYNTMYPVTSLEFEAKIAASALASAVWYAQNERHDKAINNLSSAHLMGFAIKNPYVGERLSELCRAIYKAWEVLGLDPKGFYFEEP